MRSSASVCYFSFSVLFLEHREKNNCAGRQLYCHDHFLWFSLLKRELELTSKILPKLILAYEPRFMAYDTMLFFSSSRRASLAIYRAICGRDLKGMYQQWKGRQRGTLYSCPLACNLRLNIRGKL